MRKTLNLLLVVAMVMSVGPGIAAHDTIRLHFEIYKNGELVAKPAAAVSPNTTGSVTLDAVGRIAFTPRMRNADSVVISFEIQSGGRLMTPQVAIAGEPASLAWTAEAGSDAFKLQVTWIR